MMIKLSFLRKYYSVLVVTSLFLSVQLSYAQRSQALPSQRTDRVVVLNNQPGEIPLKKLETLKIASVNMGFSGSAVFDSLLAKYAAIKGFESARYRSDSLRLDKLSGELKFFNTLIVQVTPETFSDAENLRFIRENMTRASVVIAAFGNISILKHLEGLKCPVLWSAETSGDAAGRMAQVVFGGIAASGKLAQTVSPGFRAGAGATTGKVRLTYGKPEDVGVKLADLDSIDLIAAEAIREKATPSVVVMAVKNGTVIFNKAYGSHTYDGSRPTRVSDIYDLASVTKTSATTMSTMKLYEQGKIGLDQTIGFYLPDARLSNKNDIRIREVLAHQSGVTAVSFYTRLKPEDYSRDSSASYPVKVADNYFFKRGYFDQMFWPAFLRAPIRNRGTYLYTDMNMYIMKEIVEMQSHEPLDKYVQDQFYKPLGMYTAGFLPRNRFERDRIVPTEDEGNFRKVLLHGYVHDPGASLMGGVSGHAGLFASANDLAILYQMMLNKGSYGGVRYLNPETVDLFTAKQSATSRRGLGFDRWDPDTTKAPYPSELASPETYGHTGFTGICTWIDPEHDLIYIFLSNRVHPKTTDKLYQLNIRSRIQDVIYRAVGATGK